MDQERRNYPRIRIRRKVEGRVPATPIVATLLDISETGCKAETAACRLEAGTTILLELTPKRTVAGQVAWRKGNQFGVQFAAKVANDEIAYLTGDEPPVGGADADITDQFGRRLPELKGPFENR